MEMFSRYPTPLQLITACVGDFSTNLPSMNVIKPQNYTIKKNGQNERKISNFIIESINRLTLIPPPN